MRFFRRSHIILRVFVACMIFHLLLAPYEILGGQEATHPQIVHMPIKSAVRGTAIQVVATIADRTGLDRVELLLSYGPKGQLREGIIDMKNTLTSKVMRIRVLTDSAVIYAAPTVLSDTLDIVARETILTTYEKHDEYGFYQVGLDADTEGWMHLDDAVAELVGEIYTATIPASITVAPELHYYISAENKDHNKTSSRTTSIALISFEEDVKVETDKDTRQLEESMMRTEGTTKRKPFYTSAWFIGGALLVCGGTAAILLLSNKKEESGSLSIEVQW